MHISRMDLAAHIERHRTKRIGWLREAVLGANDGIVSTTSLVMGVTSRRGKFMKYFNRKYFRPCGRRHVDGCGRICFGEFARRSERADLERERKELATNPEREHAELTAIYVERGLDAELASKAAPQSIAHDALGVHAREELGVSTTLVAGRSRLHWPQPSLFQPVDG